MLVLDPWYVWDKAGAHVHDGPASFSSGVRSKMQAASSRPPVQSAFARRRCGGGPELEGAVWLKKAFFGCVQLVRKALLHNVLT